MLFIDRVDGRRLRKATPFTALMPYLLRGRNHSAVYFSRDIDVENALAYVHTRNARLESGALPGRPNLDGGPDGRYSLFGVVLSAAARVLALRPKLNRFVLRRSIYERNHLCFSFIVKKRLSEEAGETNAKVYFEPADTIAEAMARINAGIAAARSDSPGSGGDREAALAHALPGGKALLTGAFRFLDRLNIAPGWMIRNDPLYTSIYFANLGSIGLDAPYHHLYEWGSASLFAVMGRIRRAETPRGECGGDRRRYMNFKVSVDERIADGLYFAHSAALFNRFMTHPEQLEEKPDLPAAEACTPPAGRNA